MTAFADMPYARPELNAIKAEFGAELAAFSSARSRAAAEAAVARLNALRDRAESAMILARVRHTIDTSDPAYEAENDFFDEAEPVFEGLKTDYYRALLASPYRPELKKDGGAQLFRLAELQLDTYKPEVEDDLQEENRLGSEYVKLKAGAKIPFDGRELNLAQIAPYFESPERETRARAKAAVSAFYAANDEAFGRIYHELVGHRRRIALTLGYPDFAALAYARLGRSDYDQAMVAAYRAQVLKEVVPVAHELRKRQAARLGLSSLKHYDEDLAFLSGNAAPKGDAAWIEGQAAAMYGDMSPQTGEFFTLMRSRGLMDLQTRPGKAMGGYCDYLPAWEAPFIFSNFNGTAGDVDVLTHEAGHAFQAYRSRHFAYPEYRQPTLEACEIHSMSMEFIAWPWMESFFKEDADKYRFNHLAEALMFIPYGCAVDEFQHWAYAAPEAGPAQLKAAWRRIERAYLPWRDYDGDEFLESGGFWYRQGHIFEDPFYYIDYTLAQVGAFEFWGRYRRDPGQTWPAYLRLCSLGGSLPFTGLLKEAGLSNPFASGTLKAVMAPIKAWLDGVDDKKL